MRHTSSVDAMDRMLVRVEAEAGTVDLREIPEAQAAEVLAS